MTFSELIQREQEWEGEQRALVEAVFDCGDYWGAAIGALDLGLSEELPPLLWRRWTAGAMTLDQLREAIPSIWIHNRSPVPPIGERSWLAMFKAAGFLSQVAEVVGKPSRYATELAETRPTRPLVVWRGASLDSNGRGFSWTQYQECGQGFAQAWADVYQRASGLYRAEVPGRAVLAIFGDDREQEVVVNPNMLKGRVELVATISTGETDDAAELLPKAETNSLCVDCGIDTARESCQVARSR